MRPLYLDIDDCVADSGDTLRHIIKTVTKGHVDLKYEHIRDYVYTRNTDANGRSIDQRTWDEAHDLFSTAEVIVQMKPIEGAVEAIKELQGLFDIHFITTRLHNARVPTIQWLDKLSIGPYSVHFVTKRKKHEAASKSVVAAVEDDPVQVELYREKGVYCLVPARPWNTMVGGRFDSWAEIHQNLKSLV